jgi:hypothetical protein
VLDELDELEDDDDELLLLELLDGWQIETGHEYQLQPVYEELDELDDEPQPLATP